MQFTADIFQILGLSLAILAMALGLYSNIRLRRQIKEIEDSYKTSLFDDVTRKIFDKLKENRSLAGRMTSVRVREKKELAALLADPESILAEDPATPDASLLQILVMALQKDVQALRETETAEEDQSSAWKKRRRTLFIESGSTLAYLGNALSECAYVEELPRLLRITTNNILVDQTLVFKKNVAVNLIEGTPIGRYGATFGEHVACEEHDGLIRAYRKGDVSVFAGANLYTGSPAEAESMLRDVRDYFRRYGEPAFLLMTTSNLSLEDGPHVGSFQNRDFKENVYTYAVEKGIPFLILIYDGKIEEDGMPPDTCVSVFGKDSKSAPTEEGFRPFSQAMSRGEISLLVTRRERPANGISGDTQTNAGRLFGRLSELHERGDLPLGIDVLESPDRGIRVFTARRETLRDGYDEAHPYVRFAQLLRTRELKFAGTSLPAS